MGDSSRFLGYQSRNIGPIADLSLHCPQRKSRLLQLPRDLTKSSELRGSRKFAGALIFPMKLLSICARFVLTISVVLGGHCLWAEDGIKGALSPATLVSPVNLSNPFGRTLAVADFDNDHKLDGAVLVDSGPLHGRNTFRIDLHLSSN